MKIRTAGPADLEAVTAIEAACFPAAEAADREAFAARLQVYPNHFWVMEEEGKPVAFLNGMVTDAPAISDEMFEDASLHRENGGWQAVFGLDTLPEYRGQGRAAQLMETAIADARAAGRRGCILTCKEHLIHYYERFGYQNCGKSQSVHGGAVWYDMRLEF